MPQGEALRYQSGGSVILPAAVGTLTTHCKMKTSIYVLPVVKTQKNVCISKSVFLPSLMCLITSWCVSVCLPTTSILPSKPKRCHNNISVAIVHKKSQLSCLKTITKPWMCLQKYHHMENNFCF